MTLAGSLTVRALEPRDRAPVLDLLGQAMGGGPTGHRSQEFFDWKHRDNPFGASPGQVAVDGDLIVGIRLFMRWQLEAAGRTYHALRAVDTATHPDYQRRGIFRELTLSLLAHLEETEHVDLMFNTPNADSRPGYLRMGWTEVTTLPVHIAPVRPLRFARGMLAASRANASGDASAVSPMQPLPHRGISSQLPSAAHAFQDPPALQRLIDERPTSVGLRTPLSVDYLRWRYVDPPGLDYRCVPVHRRGRLVGLGFGRLRRRADLTELTLGDVLVRGGDPRLVRAVLSAARHGGADHVAAHLSGRAASVAGSRGRARPDHLTGMRAGYLPVPNNGIRLIANPRTRMTTSPLDRAAWALSLGDLEVF